MSTGAAPLAWTVASLASAGALGWTVGQAVVAAVAAALLLRVPARRGQAIRTGCRGIAVAACCWAVAGIAQAAFGGLAGGQAPLRAADLISLAALPALVIGVAALTDDRVPAEPEAASHAAGPADPRQPGGQRAAAPKPQAAIIDGALLVAALLVIAWVAVLGPAYRSAGAGPGSFALGLARPVADIVTIGILLPMAARRPPMALLPVLALGCAAAGDCLAVAARVSGTATPVAPRLAWLACLALLAAFGWLAAGRRCAWLAARVSTPGGPRTPAAAAGGLTTLVAMAAAAAAAVVLTGYSLGGGSAASPALAVCGAAVVLLLVVRLCMLLRRERVMAVAARESDRKFLALAATTSDAVLTCDPAGFADYVSPAVGEFGYTTDQLIGRKLTEFVHPQDRPAAIRAALAVRSGHPVTFAARVRGGDSSWRQVECALSCYAPGGTAAEVSGAAPASTAAEVSGAAPASTAAEASGAAPGETAPVSSAPGKLLVTVRDVSERVALRRELEHLTYHDGLTGLPNRAFIEERVKELLAGPAPAGLERVTEVTGAILVDLDRYTAVNDLIGHGGGDLVLAQAGRRLRAAAPQEATVARWGGDEFAILVPDGAAHDVAGLADQLAAQIAAEPFSAAGRQIPLTASIGVAVTPASPEEQLLNDADVALSSAKEAGGGRVAVFSRQLQASVQHRLELAAGLSEALSGHQLGIDYQPVAELDGGRVAAIQAQIRWNRDGQQLTHAQVLAVAHDSGLAEPVGEWLLREACQQVAAWRAGGAGIGLLVAVSARQAGAAGFTATVLGAARSAGLEPEAITLEVAERVLVDSGGAIVRELSGLRARGVRLAIMGFGAGYASLSHLPQLAADVIKIDPSFVAALGTDPAMTLLTRTVVQIGHDLGVDVIADGIGRPEQAVLLRQMGCALGQGPAVGGPVRAEHVEAMLARRVAFGGSSLEHAGAAACSPVS